MPQICVSFVFVVVTSVVFRSLRMVLTEILEFPDKLLSRYSSACCTSHMFPEFILWSVAHIPRVSRLDLLAMADYFAIALLKSIFPDLGPIGGREPGPGIGLLIERRLKSISSRSYLDILCGAIGLLRV